MNEELQDQRDLAHQEELEHQLWEYENDNNPEV